MNYLKEFFSAIDWFNLLMYGLFGFMLSFSGVGVLEHPWNFLTLVAILIAVDIRSHNDGLNRGVEIMKEVWGK